MLGEMGTELSLTNLKRMPVVLSPTSQVRGSPPVLLSPTRTPPEQHCNPSPLLSHELHCSWGGKTAPLLGARCLLRLSITEPAKVKQAAVWGRDGSLHSEHPRGLALRLHPKMGRAHTSAHPFTPYPREGPTEGPHGDALPRQGLSGVGHLPAPQHHTLGNKPRFRHHLLVSTSPLQTFL